MVYIWSKCISKDSCAGSLFSSVVILECGGTIRMCDLAGSHWDHCLQKDLMSFIWQSHQFLRKQEVTEISSLAS